MLVCRRRCSTVRVIRVVGFLFFCNASPTLNANAFPQFQSDVLVQLAQAPSPSTLSMRTMPVQQAQANYDFNLNLKPFIDASNPELRYLVTNNLSFNKSGTRTFIGTLVAVTGVPNGVFQLTNKPGDCAGQALYQGQSCYLHYGVNPNAYSANATGPVITMRIDYDWKHHDAHYRGSRAFSGAGTRLVDLISPVLLPIQTVVTPQEQDGLRFDSNTLSIVGRPTRTGAYLFQIEASNGHSAEEPQTIEIHVNVRDSYFKVKRYELN